MMAITGYGFVGKAYEDYLEGRYEILIIDPKYNDNKMNSNIRWQIICVPTPSNEDGGCDMSYVLDVLENTPDNVENLIKSTISIQGWQTIRERFPNKRVAFSPEFLRATQWQSDLKESTEVILSGDDDFWYDQFNIINPDLNITRMSVDEAITVKYFRNAFLATKVSFFNHIYDFCEEYNLGFDIVRDSIAQDKRIGHSHTFVNDHGSRGWGGMCFPKDTKALTKMAHLKNINLNTLEAAILYNNKVRKKH